MDLIEQATDIVDELDLPATVRVDVISSIRIDSNALVVRIIAWTNVRDTCPRCGQRENWRNPGSCPVTLDDFGEVWAYSQEHGCGCSWGPQYLDVRVRYSTTAGDVQEEIDAMLAEIDAEGARRREDLIKSLTDEIEFAEKEAQRLLEAGTDLEDARDMITTGSDESPGLHHDGAQWINWGYYAPGQWVVVSESGLRNEGFDDFDF